MKFSKSRCIIFLYFLTLRSLENIIISERTRTLAGSLNLLELIFESLYYIFESYSYKSLSGESANLQVLFYFIESKILASRLFSYCWFLYVFGKKSMCCKKILCWNLVRYSNVHIKDLTLLYPLKRVIKIYIFLI